MLDEGHEAAEGQGRGVAGACAARVVPVAGPELRRWGRAGRVEGRKIGKEDAEKGKRNRGSVGEGKRTR